MKVGNLLDPSLTYPTNFRGRDAFLFTTSNLSYLSYCVVGVQELLNPILFYKEDNLPTVTLLETEGKTPLKELAGPTVIREILYIIFSIIKIRLYSLLILFFRRVIMSLLSKYSIPKEVIIIEVLHILIVFGFVCIIDYCLISSSSFL